MIPFSDKVNILGEVYAFADFDLVKSSVFWQDWADTLWICLASNVGYVTILDHFHWAVEGAWNDFCELLQIDPYGEYENLDAMIAFSDELIDTNDSY